MTIIEWLFGPTVMSDPDLGELRRSGRRWSGRSGDTLSFDMECAGYRLTADVRSAMVEALVNYSALDKAARMYLDGHSRAGELQVGALFHISVNRAPSGWVNSTLASDAHRTDIEVRPNDILTSLEYTIMGDGNILEVIFKADQVVTSDYR